MKKYTTISKMSRNDDKTANDAKRKRLWRYIEDCFDVLGVSLEKFKNIKKKVLSEEWKKKRSHKMRFLKV